MEKIEGLVWVDYDLLFILNADAHCNVRNRVASSSQCGQFQTVGIAAQFSIERTFALRQTENLY